MQRKQHIRYVCVCITNPMFFIQMENNNIKLRIKMENCTLPMCSPEFRPDLKIEFPSIVLCDQILCALTSVALYLGIYCCCCYCCYSEFSFRIIFDCLFISRSHNLSILFMFNGSHYILLIENIIRLPIVFTVEGFQNSESSCLSIYCV